MSNTFKARGGDDDVLTPGLNSVEVSALNRYDQGVSVKFDQFDLSN